MAFYEKTHRRCRNGLKKFLNEFLDTYRNPPDLPDAITQGEDRDDAIDMAADCLAETIGARIAERADIPAPSRLRRGQVRVDVPVHVAVKARLSAHPS